MKTKLITHVASLALAITTLTASTFANSHPEPKNVVSPHFTHELLKQETVRVKVNINRHGLVTSAEIAESTNQALNKCSLRAINQWTFKPATENGKAVASTFIQPFNYSDGTIDLAKNRKITDKAPRAISRTAPELPVEIAGISGYVNLKLNIDETGSITTVSVADASHEELVPFTEEAVQNWKFKPAIINGVAQSSTIIAPFNFKGSKIEDTVKKSIDVAKADQMPKAIKRFEPTLPLAMEKERGKAKVLLYVDEHGYVAKTDIIESSSDQLADLASEAAMQWKFKPAIKDGQAVASKVALPFVFNGGLLLSQKPVDKNPIVKSSKTPKLNETNKNIEGYVRVILQLDNQGMLSVRTQNKAHTTHLSNRLLKQQKRGNSNQLSAMVKQLNLKWYCLSSTEKAKLNFFTI